MKKRFWLFSTIILITLLIAGCGGGSGNTPPANNSNAPAEVKTVMNNFSTALESHNTATTASCLSFPYTETSIGGTKITYNSEADYLNNYKSNFSQFDISDLQFTSQNETTGEATFKATIAKSPCLRSAAKSLIYAKTSNGAETAEVTYKAELTKKDNLWKISATTPLSITGSILPDEITSLFNSITDAANNKEFTKFASYFAYPIKIVNEETKEFSLFNTPAECIDSFKDCVEFEFTVNNYTSTDITHGIVEIYMACVDVVNGPGSAEIDEHGNIISVKIEPIPLSANVKFNTSKESGTWILSNSNNK